MSSNPLLTKDGRERPQKSEAKFGKETMTAGSLLKGFTCCVNVGR